jgi:hypothetical protein
MITQPMPDKDLPYHETGSSMLFAKQHTRDTIQFAKPHTDLYNDDAWNILDNDGPLLEEIKDYYIVDDDNVQLYIKFVGQDQPTWVDYKSLHEQHPEATSAFFRQSDLPFIYPKGIVGTETLIPEEEDEDEDDNGENNQTTTDAEHEQPNTTQMENTYTIYNDYDDEQSNNNNTQEQTTITQHDGTNEDDKDSVVTDDIEDNLFEPVTDDQAPPHNVDHAPPSPIVRRSSRNRFPTSRFTYRAHAAITKHFSFDVQQAHEVEIDKIDNSMEQSHIDPLLPTPDNGKQILSYKTL